MHIVLDGSSFQKIYGCFTPCFGRFHCLPRLHLLFVNFGGRGRAIRMRFFVRNSYIPLTTLHHTTPIYATCLRNETEATRIAEPHLDRMHAGPHQDRTHAGPQPRSAVCIKQINFDNVTCISVHAHITLSFSEYSHPGLTI